MQFSIEVIKINFYSQAKKCEEIHKKEHCRCEYFSLQTSPCRIVVITIGV